MSKLLGVLPTRIISSLVPDWIHFSLNIDFGLRRKIMPDRICRVRKNAGQYLPSAAKFAEQVGK
jgi:hypothetical protein